MTIAWMTPVLLTCSLTTGVVAQQPLLHSGDLRQFVEVAPDDWRVFPAVGAAMAVGDHGVRLRSRDGERALTLELPSTWRVRPGTPSATRFTRISPQGTVRMPAAESLVFEDPEGVARLTLEASEHPRLDLTWHAPSAQELEAVRLHVQGASEEAALLRDLEAGSGAPPLRWVRRSAGSFALSLPPAEDTGSGVLVQKLVFSTFLGGNFFDGVQDIEIDANGDLVVLAASNSLDFPSLPGAYDPIADAATDSAVLGLSRDGSTLKFATFFGGSARDLARVLVLLADGSSVMAGRTESSDLPTTASAFDPTWNGGEEDGFLARLSADGSTLLGATYIGGSSIGVDRLALLEIDPTDGSLVASGRTCSSDWPTTADALLPDMSGGCDLVISRFSPDLSTLMASSFIGNTSANELLGTLRPLSDGSSLFGGATSGTLALPVTLEGKGAFPEATGDDFFFLARLSHDFDSVIWSMWTPAAFGRALENADGSLVLVGSTRDPGFPTTPGAYSDEYTGTAFHDLELVTSKISGDGKELIWSTFVTADGGVSSPAASALDEAGNIYFAGSISTPVYPFTPDAFDTDMSGLSETQLTVLDPTGSQILYASLIGVAHGSPTNEAALALDGCGGAFISSTTTMRDFPTTPGALDETFNGAEDAWIVRITALNPWTHLGAALPGIKGRPELGASGPLCEGDPTSLDIIKGPDLGTAFLVLGLSDLGAPFKGGTLIPAPDFLKPLALDANGARTLAFPWPAGTPSGLQLWLQAWMPDAAAPLGFSATNGVRASVP